MGFVTLEDFQGNIELVVFPSTWAKFAHLLDIEKIILVDGRNSGDGSDAKVIVDSISTDFKMTTPLAADSNREPRKANPAPDIPMDSMNPEEDEFFPPLPDYDDSPLPPDPFPPDLDWMGDSAGLDAPATLATNHVAEQAEPGSAPEVGSVVQPNDHPASERAVFPDQPREDAIPPQVSLQERSASPVDSERTSQPVVPPVPPPVSLPPYLTAQPARDSSQPVCMITVTLRASFDKARDVLRLRRLYGTLMSYPGNDRFALQLYEQGHGYILEFPNDTTQHCPELVARLQAMVGPENVFVSPITFQ